MKGTGSFNHVGTLGQKISFQYALFPHKFIAIIEHNARTKVIAILPVTPTPPGKTGSNPIKLFTKTKKNTVRI